jgi:thiamine-phosphate pyrophosphorylase
MKFVVISSPDKFHTEIPTLTRLFEEGLHTFHIRKPRWPAERMNEYLQMIPKRYLNRIIIHSHHKLAIKYKLLGVHLTKKHRNRSLRNRFRLLRLKLKNPKLQVTRSCHQLCELSEDSYNYAYVFLTPIFDGISKRSPSAGFSERAIRAMLPECEHDVIALGGIQPSNISKVKDLGFAGAAMLGCIWTAETDKVAVFQEAVDTAQGTNLREPFSIQVAS